MKKRILALVTALGLLLNSATMLPKMVLGTADFITVKAADSGTCGKWKHGNWSDNLKWTLDDEGTLIISGSGKMEDFYGSSPWYWIRDKIKTVIINDGINNIGAFAFSSCENLESITIPNSVINIGYDAFNECKSLTSLYLPDSVISIETSCFSGCYKLTNISVSENNPVYCSVDGALYNKDKTKLIYYHTLDENIIIPNGVIDINDGAIYNCKNVKSVTIPKSVKSIGFNVFSYSQSLTDIIIPDGVTSIGAQSFSYCTSLKNIVIPNSVTSIGRCAFSSCPNLKIKCLSGSVAEQYAKDNNIKYELLDNTTDIIDYKPISNKTITYSYKGAATENVKSYIFKYSDKMLLGDNGAIGENKNVALAACGIAMAAYEKEYLRECLKQMGFNDDDVTYYNYTYGKGEDKYLPTYEDNDHVMYAIAHKFINGKHLFVVPIRGTHGDCEWFSNFNLGTGKEHQGFFHAESEVEASLIEQFDKNNVNNDNVIILTAGHSRGAAVANILAGRLSTAKISNKSNTKHYSIEKKQIYGYTYACPNVCTYADTTLKNIHNYNNPGDLIPTLPVEENWGNKSGFLRYGQTHDLYKNKNVYNDFLHRFAEDTGKKYMGLSTAKEANDLLQKIAKDQDTFNKPANKLLFDLISASLMEDSYYAVLEKNGYTDKTNMISDILAHYGISQKSQDAFKELMNGPEGYIIKHNIVKGILLSSKTIIPFAAYETFPLVKRIITEGSNLDFIAHGHTGETYIHWLNAYFNTRKDLNHSFSSRSVKPSFGIDGYTIYECITCDYSYKADYVPYSYSLNTFDIKISNDSKTYNGKSQKPTITIKNMDFTVLKEGTDYTIEWLDDTVNAGSKNFKIIGKGKYKGNITKTYTISRASLSSATVKTENKTYTGQKIFIDSKVTIGKKTLINGTDYTVTFKNNKAVGTATVTIKGKGNYTGSISKTFKINPKKTTLKTATSPKTKQLKVTYSKVSGVTGYQTVYSTSSKFTKATTKTASSKSTSKTISGLTKGKTYYVKVRTYKTVNGTKYYSGYSAVKKIKIK